MPAQSPKSTPLPPVAALFQPGWIVKFGCHVTPPSRLIEPQICASSFWMPLVPLGTTPLSLRQSYHAAARAPVVGSTEILPRNWLRVVLSSFTRIGLLQVAPLLSV